MCIVTDIRKVKDWLVVRQMGWFNILNASLPNIIVNWKSGLAIADNIFYLILQVLWVL